VRTFDVRIVNKWKKAKLVEECNSIGFNKSLDCKETVARLRQNLINHQPQPDNAAANNVPVANNGNDNAAANNATITNESAANNNADNAAVINVANNAAVINQPIVINPEQLPNC